MKFKVPILVGCSLFLIILLLFAAQIAPLEAAKHLLSSSLGSPRAIAGTLRSATPLLVAGVAVYLALRAGLFNIGVEGQLIIGAMVSAFIGLQIHGGYGVLLAILGAMFGGALWALPAGLIKAYRGGHEVITTIMLNNVAIHLTTALVAGPLRDRSQEGATTAFLDETTRLPMLLSISNVQFSLNLAFLIGLFLLILFILWLYRTVSGYETTAVGANPRAAKLAGVAVPRSIIHSMITSGAVAGLAGALQVLAYQGRFFEGFSPGYGYDALGVALLAGNSPWGILPSALLFGALDKGASAIQLFGVPKGFSGVVLGLLIICFAAYRYRREKTNV